VSVLSATVSDLQHSRMISQREPSAGHPPENAPLMSPTPLDAPARTVYGDSRTRSSSLLQARKGLSARDTYVQSTRQPDLRRQGVGTYM
jgi:hypothetical protein